jgi:hypothetical protein
MQKMDTSEELIKECIIDLYFDPRNKIRKWSELTNQTCQIRLAYPGQHIASLITGIKGIGTAARGDDLSDGSEIKTCSRADQLNECKECRYRVLGWQKVCPECGSSNINIKTDSHWIFPITTESELKLLLDEIPRIILILFDKQSDETDDIQLRAWVINPHHSYVRDFFEDYYYNNYVKKTQNGSKPAPCNLHPLKYDFFMMEPQLLFQAVLNIESQQVEILVWNRENPMIEKFPTSLLLNDEKKTVFKEEIDKGLSLERVISENPHIPDSRKNRLKMRQKALKTSKTAYRRR